MPNLYLPKNKCIIDNGDLLHSFNNTNNLIFDKQTGGTMALDPNFNLFRMPTAKITIASDASAQWANKLGINIASLNINGISKKADTWGFYAHIPAPQQWLVKGLSNVGLRVGKNTADNKRCMAAATTDIAYAFGNGWYKFKFHRSQFTPVNNGRWTDPINEVRAVIYNHNNAANYGMELHIGGFFVGEQETAIIVPTSDDCTSNVPNLLDYSASRDVPWTCYVVSNWVGTGGKMSLAQMQSYKAQSDAYRVAKGKSLVAFSNHTINHFNLTDTFVTEQNIVDYTQPCSQYLINNGLADNNPNSSAYDVAYPVGAYNQTVINKMKEMGMKSGRTIQQWFNSSSVIDMDDHWYKLNTAIVGSYNSNVLDKINLAKLQGGIIPLLLHEYRDNVTDTNYQVHSVIGKRVIDALSVMQKAGEVRLMTLEEARKYLEQAVTPIALVN